MCRHFSISSYLLFIKCKNGKRKDFEIVFIKIKKEKLNRSFSIIGPRRAGKTYLMYIIIKESIKNIK
jgi:predicted AAA+ superfamily ATPase